MKIHIGSGSVYLDGWLNVDVRADGTFLADDKPELVAQWRTTEDRYYARHTDKNENSLRSGPLFQDYVCDKYGSFADIPALMGQADEVLTRQSFEHLSISEAHVALDEIDRVLKLGGALRIDVPDHEATMRKFAETTDPFYIRHLLGPRRDKFGYHMMSYSRDSLIKLVEDHGFIFAAEEENIHFYPAFCLRFVKPVIRPACEYALPPFTIPDNWKVADVGPGRFPFKRADVYIDINPLVAELACRNGRIAIHDDLAQGLKCVGDKEFDYVFCSHVLEHLDDPQQGAATLSRIAKRGTVVFPGMLKEFLFNFEESEHKWFIVPSPNGGAMFVRRNPELVQRLIDINVTKIMSRLFRTGPNRIDPEQRHLRRWFYENEASLDVIVHWENELRLQVIND